MLIIVQTVFLFSIISPWFNADSRYLHLISNLAGIHRFSEDTLTSNLRAVLNYDQDNKTKYLQDDSMERVQY